MTRRILLLAMVMAMLGGASAVAATGTPVFAALEPGEAQYPGSVGFGQVKPSTVSDGGASGICHIHWVSWGGRFAIGTGIGLAVNPDTYKNYPARVVVVLSDVGTWHSRRAYTRYTLAYPQSANTHVGLKRCKVQKQATGHTR